MLKYSLNENLLTERPDDYSAQVHPTGTYDKEAIINRMLQRGTLVTRTDIVAVLNNFEETICEITEEGGMANTPLFNTSFSMSGVFDGPMDAYDGNRHKLNVNISKGVKMREIEKKTRFEKTNAVAPLPLIQEVKDSLSGTVNEKLTPNGVVELRGSSIKIDGDKPECGLWFVFEDGTEKKAAVMIENKPARVIAMIPSLVVGEYQVKIVTQHTGSGTLLKTPKTTVFTKTLVVSQM